MTEKAVLAVPKKISHFGTVLIFDDFGQRNVKIVLRNYVKMCEKYVKNGKNLTKFG